MINRQTGLWTQHLVRQFPEGLKSEVGFSFTRSDRLEKSFEILHDLNIDAVSVHSIFDNIKYWNLKNYSQK